MKNMKIILDVERFERHLIEKFSEDKWALGPSEVNVGIWGFVKSNVLAPLHEELTRHESVNKNRAISRRRPSPQGKLREVDVRRAPSMPNINWDRIPLLLNKKDMVRYLDLPEQLINRWIKEGKIVMRKRVGMRPYALTDEIKHAFPDLYKELKEA
jgi:hypothetical protein